MDHSGSPTRTRTDYVITPEPWRVRDIPERLRPREEMARLGARHVSDDILLAVILRSGVKGVNVVRLAQTLLREHGSLTALAAAPAEELVRYEGMGPVKTQVLAAAFEIARRLSQEQTPDRPPVRTPGDAAALLAEDARPLENEVFWVLCLDAKNRLKGAPVEITRGILDASLVHPREVFRSAIRTAAAAVVLVHNHPSGDPAPSSEDLRITRQLVEAGKVVDISVLDHVILGRPSAARKKGFLSLREEGIMQFES